MRNSIESAPMVCEVPVALQLRLSITHRTQNVPPPAQSGAQDLQIGPKQSELVVVSPASASDEDVRSLYVMVAENAPELLRGVWYRLHKLVCADPSAWVYPSVAMYDGIDGEYEPAHIDIEALALVWPELLQRARQVCVKPRSV